MRFFTASVRVASGLVLGLAIIAGVAIWPQPVVADEAAATFIGTLGNQALAVIQRPDIQPASKIAYFDQLIRQDFDLTSICRFVLGPYWRIASPAEQQEFANLFTTELINLYGRQLAQSGNGDFIVTGSRSDPSGIVVTSRIVSRHGQSIDVEWRLGLSDGHYKIEDVAIDGVSMELAQRSEVAQLLARWRSDPAAARDNARAAMSLYASATWETRRNRSSTQPRLG